jgi:hypothetical protein
VFLADIGGGAEAGQTGTITDKSDATDARLHVRVPVKAGPRLVAATFIRKIAESTNRLRPFLRSNAGTYDSTGRPHVKSLTIKGPFNPTGPGDTPSRQRVFVCRPPESRPVGDRDLAPLMEFYRDGRKKGSFDSGVQLALRRLLASPTFIFRVEEDPGSVAAGAAYRVSDLELASRLSFFLWSSMPDDALLDVAAAGRLRHPAVLEAQVRRMLADARSSALVEEFGGQWLQFRALESVAPDREKFPAFDNYLRLSMRNETMLFFEHIVRKEAISRDSVPRCLL